MVRYTGQGQTIEATNGAQVIFDVDAPQSDPVWGNIVCSNDFNGISVKVSAGTSSGEKITSFVVETSAANGFDMSKVTEGQDLIKVIYPGSEG